jgi:lipooligosaccharide transport system ATP-binding protein
MTAAVEARGLVKRYGDLTAVRGIDFEVRQGECFGFLGPNGAGKTSTMKAIYGLANVDGGELRVLGLDARTDRRAIKSRIGVVPQEQNLDGELSVRENLEMQATYHGIRVDGRVDDLLRAALLEKRADAKPQELSGGMKRRLLIARGLIHQPKLVLLDEPTVGLDPQVRQELWSLIAGLRTGGTTVMMSTHYIEEAERLADDVAVMNHGRVIAQGRPSDLVAEHAGKSAAEYYGPPVRLAEIERLARAAGFPTRRTGPSISVLRAEDIPPSLAEALGGDGVLRSAVLEDVFVALTGEVVE